MSRSGWSSPAARSRTFRGARGHRAVAVQLDQAGPARSSKTRRRAHELRAGGAQRASVRERPPEAGARSAHTSRSLLRAGDRHPVTVCRTIAVEKIHGTPVFLACELPRRDSVGLSQVHAPVRRRTGTLTAKVQRDAYREPGCQRRATDLRRAAAAAWDPCRGKRVARLIAHTEISGIPRKPGRTAIRAPGQEGR